MPLWRPAAGARPAVRGGGAHDPRHRRPASTASLVVTVIGPSGSGKSTLVNALAGGAELSPTGRRRPTTGRLRGLRRRRGGRGGARRASSARDSVEVAARCGRALAARAVPDRHARTPTARPSAGTSRRWSAPSRTRTCWSASSMPKTPSGATTPIFWRRSCGASTASRWWRCSTSATGWTRPSSRTQILPDFRDYLQAAWRRRGRPGAVRLRAGGTCRTRAGTRRPSRATSSTSSTSCAALVFGLAARGRVRDRPARRERPAAARGRAGARPAASSRPTARRSAPAGRRWRRPRRRRWRPRPPRCAATTPRRGGGMGAQRSTRRFAMRWVGPVGWVLALWTRLMVARQRARRGLAPGRGRSGAGCFGRRARRKGGARGGRERPGGGAARLPHGAAAALAGGGRAAGPRAASIRPCAASRPPLAAAERFAERLSEPVGRRPCEREIERDGRGGSAGAWLQLLLNAPVVGILGYVGWITVGDVFQRGLSRRAIISCTPSGSIAIALLLSFLLFRCSSG
ncbi:MAG: GTPase domain-containing protein [Desulfobacterales bacterium]|nr:GTPase domain-containing protein [Desulfobacterales bacterium]